LFLVQFELGCLVRLDLEFFLEFEFFLFVPFQDFQLLGGIKVNTGGDNRDEQESNTPNLIEPGAVPMLSGSR